MRATQRQAIRECIEAAEIHREAVGGFLDADPVNRDEGQLADVREGLGISIAKLEDVLKDDACDAKRRLVLMAKLGWFIETAKKELASVKGKAKESWRTPHALFDQEDVTEKQATMDAFLDAKSTARRAIDDGGNPIDALREWASSTLASLRVISRARPIKGVLAEVNEQNGIKTAVRAVIDYLDLEIRH